MRGLHTVRGACAFLLPLLASAAALPPAEAQFNSCGAQIWLPIDNNTNVLAPGQAHWYSEESDLELVATLVAVGGRLDLDVWQTGWPGELCRPVCPSQDDAVETLFDVDRCEPDICCEIHTYWLRVRNPGGLAVPYYLTKFLEV